jgi:hypothetical protein
MHRYGTRPERVARAVLRGIRRNRGTLRVGWDSHLTGFLGWIAPPLMPSLLERAHRRQMLGETKERAGRD